ncbi:DUF1076 domain-containing protein, partial [Escherichia coli]|nr:DUF1076 domain-containing protein [Escherichia coli]
FRPDSNHFSCPESFLTCPITLDTPETGGAHPLSREPITESMIMRKDECHFDTKREAFCCK